MIRPVCAHCGETVEVRVVLDTSKLAAEVRRELKPELEKLMTALENLQAADLAEEGELEAFLADIAGKLDGNDDPAIQAVADSINARVAKMQAADPATAPAAPPDGDTSGDQGSGDTPAA